MIKSRLLAPMLNPTKVEIKRSFDYLERNDFQNYRDGFTTIAMDSPRFIMKAIL